MKTLDPGLARVLKRLHYPLEVMLTESVQQNGCARRPPIGCGTQRAHT